MSECSKRTTCSVRHGGGNGLNHAASFRRDIERASGNPAEDAPAALGIFLPNLRHRVVCGATKNAESCVWSYLEVVAGRYLKLDQSKLNITRQNAIFIHNIRLKLELCSSYVRKVYNQILL